MERVEYDEMGLFHENAAELGLPFESPPVVARVEHRLDDGRVVSGLRWGTEAPELVLVHGSAMNAHTWDSVALALRPRPLLALDLPGHGRSSWRDDLDYRPRTMARDLAAAIDALAPRANDVVGMSLGGLTCLALAVQRPDLVRRLMMVDITPGTNREKAKAIIDFVNGPQAFPDLDALVARTIEHNPTRSRSSLVRGVLHNARQLDDGSWEWRYDRRGRAGTINADRPEVDLGAATSELWDDVAALDRPLLLVRGGTSPVVDDADVAALLERQPSALVEVVDGAGHSVQGDRPLELAALISSFMS